MISLNAKFFIDATRKGSLVRFINHSCLPNCETRKWTILGETRVGIFAKQDISIGIELTYDYNFEWYGGATVRCLCGAPKCSIFLGGKSHGFQEYNHLWEEGDDSVNIAVISVEPLGVVQFGSIEKLPERMELVIETKKLFQEIDKESISLEISPSTSNGDVFGLIESLTSSISSSPYLMSPKTLPSPDFADLFEFDDQFQNYSAETQDKFCSNEFDIDLWKSPFQSATNFNTSQPSGSSVPSFDGLNLTSPWGTISQDNVFWGMPNHLEYCTNTTQTQASFSILEEPSWTDDFVAGLSTPSLSEQTNLNVCNSFQGEKLLNKSAIDVVFSSKMPEGLENNIKPGTSGQEWDFGTSNSGCTSEHSIGSKEWPSNRLFSKLGLDKILNDNPSSSSSFVRSTCNDQLSSNKRRRTGSPFASSYSVKPSDIYSFERNLKVAELETASWIRDFCGMNVKNNNSQSKEHEIPSMPVKKKAKRGTRPIPKDRIRTYERLAELRKLIPNGEKMSIDRLLNQTIKQLLFLQSVTRRAEGLKKDEELKDRKDKKETGFNSNGSGVTWACEIENQTMVCPLIVEDLCTPGQMLIEILCQEQGFFLEIVDIVRGFGLNILKGIMELRVPKIWAHFVVEAEANRTVSRHEIFSSLLQLLQPTEQSDLHVNDQLGNFRDGRSSPLNYCSESSVPFPIGMPEGIPCSSL